MSSVHDRLAALAAEVDPHTVPADRALWDRGRRWYRLRRGGTLAITVAVVAVVAGTVGLAEHRGTPTPAPAGSPGGVPERIHAPSGWLPGTADEGPLGPLAALVTAERSGWWGSERGYVGVSAETGEYRFLDLPDAAPQAEGTLSPDGRFVAYWTTGPTEGPPNTLEGEPPATGIGLYDTRTGEVARADVPTEHGLMTSTLGWVARDQVLAELAQYAGGEGDPAMDRSSGAAAPVLVWDVDDPAPRRLGSAVVQRGSVLEPRASGYLTVPGEQGLTVVPVARPSESRRYRHDANLSTGLDAGPGRRWAAGIWGGPREDRTWNPNRLVAARLPAGTADEVVRLEPTVLRQAGRYRSVLGWLDPAVVVVAGYVGRPGSRTVVSSVDLRSGAADELVLGPPESSGAAFEVATELLREPTVDAVAPPRPVDPRLSSGLVGGTVLAGAAALLWWRRRVRP